ncbi:MAG: response regulator transcription factor [Pseudomonadota bacterium]
MPDPRKPRVLIADDEAHIRLLIKTVFKTMQAEIAAEAKNGQEAVDLYRKEKPDLLMLDINMPLKTGAEVLAEIRGEFPTAFVTMLTSVADMATVRQCLEAGASGYILKDTPLPEMKQLIKEAWEENRKAQRG